MRFDVVFSPLGGFLCLAGWIVTSWGWGEMVGQQILQPSKAAIMEYYAQFYSSTRGLLPYGIGPIPPNTRPWAYVLSTASFHGDRVSIGEQCYVLYSALGILSYFCFNFYLQKNGEIQSPVYNKITTKKEKKGKVLFNDPHYHNYIYICIFPFVSFFFLFVLSISREEKK